MGSRYYLPPHRNDRDRITIAHVVVVYCVVSFTLTMAYPALRVLSYGIPFLAVIAMLSAERFTLPPHAAPFIVLIVSGLAYAPFVKLVGWQDLYLMLIGLTPFLFGWRYRFSWPAVFIASVGITVFWLAFGRTADPGGGAVEFDPLKSRSSFESPMSWIFGLLAVWAALERRWGRTALSLLACILTLKRIVIVGAIAAILVWLLPRRIVRWLLSPLPMLAANALYLVLVVAYTQGHFDALIYEFTGQSGNQLGMGRQAAYARPVAELLAHPVEFLFYGTGPGGVYELLKGGWTFLPKANLHNDSLKILIEYGGIVWIAFFSALYLHRDVRVRVMMLFYNFVLLTDNSLIYTYVIFALGLALWRILDPEPVAAPLPPSPPGRAPPRGTLPAAGRAVRPSA